MAMPSRESFVVSSGIPTMIRGPAKHPQDHLHFYFFIPDFTTPSPSAGAGRDWRGFMAVFYGRPCDGLFFKSQKISRTVRRVLENTCCNICNISFAKWLRFGLSALWAFHCTHSHRPASATPVSASWWLKIAVPRGMRCQNMEAPQSTTKANPSPIGVSRECKTSR